MWSSPAARRIGARTRIFPFASIGHQPQDLKYHGEPSTLDRRRRLHDPRGRDPQSRHRGRRHVDDHRRPLRLPRQLARRARLPGRQQRHLLQQRHAGRPLHGRRLRHPRRRRGGDPVRPRRRAFVSRRHVGAGERSHPLRHGARQPRAPVRPQHRRPAAARLLARPTSTTCAAPTGCCSPPKARCSSAPRTWRRSSPASPIVQEILAFIRAGGKRSLCTPKEAAEA